MRIFLRRVQNSCSPLKLIFRNYSSSAHAPPPEKTLNLNDVEKNDLNDLISEYASRPTKPVTLKELVRYGRPPLSPLDLLASARDVLDEIPVRLAHRIAAMRRLPFIVVRNPHIHKIYSLYTKSFLTLVSHSRIKSVVENEQLTRYLVNLVEDHSNTIPVLALGFRECREYFSSGEITKFLDKHLRARIGTRILAEQHVAMQFQNSSMVGVVDTKVSPKQLISQCAEFVGEICEMKYGLRPEVRFDGHVDAQLAYIPNHLEYIFTEVLKNAFRATAEAHRFSPELPPVEVTIASCDDVFQRTTIRIRDRGGGIDPENMNNIWRYSYSTFKNESEDDDGFALLSAGNNQSSIAGLGYGLPLSRAYSEYFGGCIALESCFGWGTDVYIHLDGLDVDTYEDIQAP